MLRSGGPVRPMPRMCSVDESCSERTDQVDTREVLLQYVVPLLGVVLVLCGGVVRAGDLDTQHLVSGRAIETNNKIIVKGARFVVRGEQKAPVISLQAGSKKKVILDGVEIVTDGASFRSNDGDAGVVVIDNEKSDSKVVIRNLKVRSHNTSVNATSMADSVCAAAICNKSGRYDSMRSTRATASGQTNISAIQGQRPDYRKVNAR